MPTQLQTINLTSQYGQQQTASPVADKIASHVIAVDPSGNVGGSLYSPTIITTQANALGVAGLSYIHSSGNLPLSLAGNIRFLFQNPAGSGVMSNITAMAAFSSLANAILPMMYLNPTAGVPTTKGFATNVFLGGAQPKCQVFADSNLTTALSGGTQLLPFQIPQGRTVYSQLSMYLSPGQSLGVAIPVLAAGTVEVSVYSNETTI